MVIKKKKGFLARRRVGYPFEYGYVKLEGFPPRKGVGNLFEWDNDGCRNGCSGQ